MKQKAIQTPLGPKTVEDIEGTIQQLEDNLANLVKKHNDLVDLLIKKGVIE
jgi:hypothetical protein